MKSRWRNFLFLFLLFFLVTPTMGQALPAIPSGKIIAWGIDDPRFTIPANNSGFIAATSTMALKDDGTVVNLL